MIFLKITLNFKVTIERIRTRNIKSSFHRRGYCLDYRSVLFCYLMHYYFVAKVIPGFHRESFTWPWRDFEASYLLRPQNTADFSSPVRACVLTSAVPPRIPDSFCRAMVVHQDLSMLGVLGVLDILQKQTLIQYKSIVTSHGSLQLLPRLTSKLASQQEELFAHHPHLFT